MHTFSLHTVMHICVCTSHTLNLDKSVHTNEMIMEPVHTTPTLSAHCTMYMSSTHLCTKTHFFMHIFLKGMHGTCAQPSCTYLHDKCKTTMYKLKWLASYETWMEPLHIMCMSITPLCTKTHFFLQHMYAICMHVVHITHLCTFFTENLSVKIR